MYLICIPWNHSDFDIKLKIVTVSLTFCICKHSFILQCTESHSQKTLNAAQCDESKSTPLINKKIE